MSMAIFFGATGAAGRQALSYALHSSTFSTIYAVGRRPFTFPCQGVPDPSPSEQSKLTNVVVCSEDFGDSTKLASKLPSALLSAASRPSAVIVTLASTRADAESVEVWERISRHYVVSVARAARTSGTYQRLVYCSVSARMANQWASGAELMLYEPSRAAAPIPHLDFSVRLLALGLAYMATRWIPLTFPCLCVQTCG